MDNCEVRKAYKIPFNKCDNTAGQRIFFDLEDAQKHAPKQFNQFYMEKRVVEPDVIFLIFDKESNNYYEIGSLSKVQIN